MGPDTQIDELPLLVTAEDIPLELIEELDFVVKTVLDGRADGDLSLREEGLHRLRHDMRGAMVVDLLPLGIVKTNRLDLGIFGQGPAEIHRFTVDTRRDQLKWH